MVAAAGGAPAVNRRIPLGAPARSSAGALATPMSNGGRGAKHGDVFVFDELKDARWFNFAKANVSHAPGGVDPGERPAIRVEHGQCPQIPVTRCQMVVREGAHDVHVGISMGNHHTLGARRGAAGVVDSDEVGFGDRDLFVVRRMRGERCFIRQPIFFCAF